MFLQDATLLRLNWNKGLLISLGIFRHFLLDDNLALATSRLTTESS